MNIYPYFTVQVNNVHWTLDELKQHFCNCSQLLNYWWVLQRESWQGSHGPLILRETGWLQGERLVTPFKNKRLVTPFENTKPVLPFEYERPVPPFERRGRYWRLPLEDNCPPSPPSHSRQGSLHHPSPSRWRSARNRKWWVWPSVLHVDQHHYIRFTKRKVKMEL